MTKPKWERPDATICVKSYDNTDVYLSTLNLGPVIPAILQRALQRRDRWEYRGYLTTVIFLEMFKASGNSLDDEKGFWIAGAPQGNTYRLLSVDTEQQTVTRLLSVWDSVTSTATLEPKEVWSFDAFIELTANQLKKVWKEE